MCVVVYAGAVDDDHGLERWDTTVLYAQGTKPFEFSSANQNEKRLTEITVRNSGLQKNKSDW